MDPSQTSRLSVRRQCALLCLASSSYYYQPAPESAENLFCQRLLDEEYTRHPFYGVRKMTVWLQLQRYAVGPKRDLHRLWSGALTLLNPFRPGNSRDGWSFPPGLPITSAAVQVMLRSIKRQAVALTLARNTRYDSPTCETLARNERPLATTFH
jgi:hypothetical protein